jgi:hypothetical protein
LTAGKIRFVSSSEEFDNPEESVGLHGELHGLDGELDRKQDIPLIVQANF